MGTRYYTIHVTPEESHSYASFESNVPLSGKNLEIGLQALVSKVVNIFEPGKFTVTIFKSYSKSYGPQNILIINDIERYTAKDKILYEFEDYLLRYAHFESNKY